MPQKFGKILASWRVSEFEKHERTALWYIGFGVLGVVLLIIALVTINYLFALIIIITALIIYLQEKAEAHMVTFLITSRGIKVGRSECPYKDIGKFWIIYDPPHVKKLYFNFKNLMKTSLMVPLKSQNPLMVRDILLNFLEEDLEREEEPLSEVFGRLSKL